jgi:hypothetical protein
MRANVDAMSARYGSVFSFFLRLFIVRRATAELSGQILVDPHRMHLVRESGFAKLNWSELVLPQQGALVLQHYRAALVTAPTNEFELVRVVAAPLRIPRGQPDLEERAMTELAELARGIRQQVWVAEEPPLPPTWTIVFCGLGHRVAKSIALPLADVLRVSVFDAAHWEPD